MRASLDAVCPKCGRLIPPAEVRRIDFERIECPVCREQFVPSPIPPRCEPPLPNACKALWPERWSDWKFSQPVTQHSQNDLPDERDTRSAFPSHLSKVDFGAFVRECVEKNSIDFLARVIREACLRVQGNLETAVEFLLRPRRPGLSLDHWLRPGPAKTDHFFAGVNTIWYFAHSLLTEGRKQGVEQGIR